MSQSVEDLVQQLSSPDFNERALALAGLIMKGRDATVALTQLLDSPDQELRASAVQGLAEIADPASADTLARLLDDDDDVIRARAAQGLALMNDSRALEALIHTINDGVDMLHGPQHTLSTYGLIRMGPRALPAVAPLLKSDDQLTRERAFVVIRGIVSKLPEGQNWDALWQSLGGYDPRGTTPERERAADQWKDWIGRHS